MKDYSVFLISNKPDRYAKIQESILPELLYYFDGTNVPTFSTLVNRCVEASMTETVILLGDKVYPKQEHIQKMIALLDKGIGFVGLYKFGMFGFKKELLRRIGMFDERYVGGGYEDLDFLVRLIEANIALYVTEEVEYKVSNSSWNYNLSANHWTTKWEHVWHPNKQEPDLVRTLPEETYKYNLGPSVPTKFLTCKEHSYMTSPMLTPFMYMNISSHIPIKHFNS